MKALFYSTLLLLFSSNILYGQTGSEKKLFDSADMLELELYFDIPSFLNSRETEKKLNAELAYFDEDSIKHTLKSKIRVRGNFRKREENCAFPPYSLYFDSANVANSLFENQKKIKFVSHCNEGKTVLEEYLLYKTFGIITNHAYQVRMANVNYIDLAGDYMAFNEFAFLLENTKKLGKRLHGKVIDPHTLHIKEFDQLTVANIALFQYLIGNTDWDLIMQKNFKYVKVKENTLIPVAYDFDLAEVINTYYPTHESIFGKETINRRAFKCLDIDKHIFFTAVESMLAKKEEVYALYFDFPYLSNTRKVEILNYYETFFEKLKKKRRLYRELKKACKK